MKFTTNEQTGHQQATFSSELLSISDTVMQNSNNKNFKVVGLKFKDSHGVIQKSTGIIYEGNYSKGVEVGRDYLTTATLVGKDVYLQMSHLESLDGRADASMFAFEAAEAEVKADKTVETKKS